MRPDSKNKGDQREKINRGDNIKRRMSDFQSMSLLPEV